MTIKSLLSWLGAVWGKMNIPKADREAPHYESLGPIHFGSDIVQALYDMACAKSINCLNDAVAGVRPALNFERHLDFDDLAHQIAEFVDTAAQVSRAEASEGSER